MQDTDIKPISNWKYYCRIIVAKMLNIINVIVKVYSRVNPWTALYIEEDYIMKIKRVNFYSVIHIVKNNYGKGDEYSSRIRLF